MTEVSRLLQLIDNAPRCQVLRARGLPSLREGDVLPDDLMEFFRLAGGARLFDGSEYPIRIVGPEEFIRSNPEIVGAESADDLTDTWYIVARGSREEALSIDCSPSRTGRCYDSFWDRHGVVGDCRIVAKSFGELLRRLYENAGGYWYWLGSDAPNYGDAYER